MHVSSAVVANVFPVLVVVLLAAVPLRGVGKPAAFVTASFVATAAYIVSVAAVVRATVKPAVPETQGPAAHS